MLLIRSLVIVCAIASNLACSERPLSPTAVTQSREVAGAGGQAAACSSGVFTDTARRGDIDPSGGRGVMRLRYVEVDLAAVRRSAETKAPLTLNIFPDACIVAEITSVERDAQGRLMLTGAIADAAEPVSITLVAADDFVIGNAVSSRAVYTVQYAGNGVHVVMQINPAAFPPD
jgi:hypothetical protein